ncbi:DsbA family protein [Halomonas sp.]|uniref:DsbA family oxidoreductase n=1 Tax=Halomonas sp. TaxID=1486246 RepID=UPI000C969E5A|nr:DsbA family protein [Halomonas sp.]MAR71134.1 disulfide bond formation protein DsbA [Halomonas sp.]|tara:strand:+ start:467 stop:1147 length:681 start_codon:yes stop_codon:yes gene_type:complete
MPTPPAPPRLTLEVFSDLRCPFCYLELPELEALEDRFGHDIRVVWRPFELRPEPEPAHDPHCDYLNELWRDAVLPMAQERGLSMRQPNIQPRSRLALETLAWAERRYRDTPSASQVAALRKALFSGFFEDSLDLSDPRALAEIANQLGLDGAALEASLAAGEDREAVQASREEGQALGVHGVPALRFLVDGEHAGILSGTQPRRQLFLAVERLQDALRQHEGKRTS